MLQIICIRYGKLFILRTRENFKWITFTCIKKSKKKDFHAFFELFNFILVFLWRNYRYIFSHYFHIIRVVVRYRKYIAHEIQSWVFSYLIASTSKYFRMKVACCPWNHTMCHYRADILWPNLHTARCHVPHWSNQGGLMFYFYLYLFYLW